MRDARIVASVGEGTRQMCEQSFPRLAFLGGQTADPPTLAAVWRGNTFPGNSAPHVQHKPLSRLTTLTFHSLHNSPRREPPDCIFSWLSKDYKPAEVPPPSPVAEGFTNRQRSEKEDICKCRLEGPTSSCWEGLQCSVWEVWKMFWPARILRIFRPVSKHICVCRLRLETATESSPNVVRLGLLHLFDHSLFLFAVTNRTITMKFSKRNTQDRSWVAIWFVDEQGIPTPFLLPSQWWKRARAGPGVVSESRRSVTAEISDLHDRSCLSSFRSVPFLPPQPVPTLLYNTPKNPRQFRHHEPGQKRFTIVKRLDTTQGGGGLGGKKEARGDSLTTTGCGLSFWKIFQRPSCAFGWWKSFKETRKMEISVHFHSTGANLKLFSDKDEIFPSTADSSKLAMS